MGDPVTSACPLHQWNQPCFTCAQAIRHTDDWLARLWRSGHTPRAMRTDKIVHLQRQERVLVSVPEVDPVTRTSTGRLKPYGYVDLPIGVTDGA